MKLKKFFGFVLALALLATPACAKEWFTVTRIDDVDYGNHRRLYINMDIQEWYPYSGQAAIRVYFARDHAIGNELPQFDNMLLYVPTYGFGFDRVFWVAKPAGLTGTWNLRVDIEDVYQVVLATSGEFEWVFAEDAPVVPTEWVASVPWAVCNDLWQTSIALHNPTDQPATATLAFHSTTGQAVAPGGLLFIERYIPPYGISAFYIDDFFPPGAVFAGSILMSADAPLDYLYLTTDGTGYLTYCAKFE